VGQGHQTSERADLSPVPELAPGEVLGDEDAEELWLT
jgi:hypothetical protein